jgi:hypothetical protein
MFSIYSIEYVCVCVCVCVVQVFSMEWNMRLTVEYIIKKKNAKPSLGTRPTFGYAQTQTQTQTHAHTRTHTYYIHTYIHTFIHSHINILRGPLLLHIYNT